MRTTPSAVSWKVRLIALSVSRGCARELVKEFGFIDLLTAQLLGSSKDQPDSVLFEMRIGLLGVRNGWGDGSRTRAPPGGRHQCSEESPDRRYGSGRARVRDPRRKDATPSV
jgi:hypothetical protein